MAADSFADFGASFKGFMDQMAKQAPVEEPFFLRELKAHFGAEPSRLTLVKEAFDATEHANVQLALERWLERAQGHRLLGIAGDHPYMRASLSSLAAPGGGLMGGGTPTEGAVQYENLEVDGKGLPCLQLGLLLVKAGAPISIFVAGPSQMTFRAEVTVEAMAPERAQAETFLADLRKLMHERNVYRSRVLSMSVDERRQLKVHFHRLPAIAREQVILPDGLMDRIERQAVAFSRVAAKLKAAGRHLRRGMLLHGPPGTGKTFTAMYLAGQMPERTVLLVTGRGAGLLEQACSMARKLEPATVVIEDIDLIAEDRERGEQACAPLLFELLNQMDGLSEDADILFVLTTNRPQVLEPALAARPGRIDLALEVPLPDAGCRTRLFQLYARGLNVSADLAPYVKRTEGASAAFIRELLRKAALYAAGAGDVIEVKDEHLDAALHELVVGGGAVTRALLGAKTTA